MRQSLSTLLFFIADILGMNRIFLRLYAKHRRILMYHGVTSVKTQIPYWTQLPLEQFKSQMEYVKLKCRVVKLNSLKEGNDRVRVSDDSRPPAVITFDDGYRSVYDHAWPLLREMNLPATVFVVTGKHGPDEFIWTDLIYGLLVPEYNREIDLSPFGLGKLPAIGSRRERARDIDHLKVTLKSYAGSDRRAVLDYLLEQYPLTDEAQMRAFHLMTDKEIREMADSQDVTIASHSHSHPILSTLSPEEQRREIDGSLRQLAEWGVPASGLFAYPNGRRQDFNEHTVDALRERGVSMAVTTLDDLSNPSDDPHFIKRINIRADINIWEFKARISGLYYFLRKAYRKAKHQKDRTEE